MHYGGIVSAVPSGTVVIPERSVDAVEFRFGAKLEHRGGQVYLRFERLWDRGVPLDARLARAAEELAEIGFDLNSQDYAGTDDSVVALVTLRPLTPKASKVKADFLARHPAFYRELADRQTSSEWWEAKTAWIDTAKDVESAYAGAMIAPELARQVCAAERYDLAAPVMWHLEALRLGNRRHRERIGLKARLDPANEEDYEFIREHILHRVGDFWGHGYQLALAMDVLGQEVFLRQYLDAYLVVLRDLIRRHERGEKVLT